MCIEDLFENEIINNLSYMYNKDIKDDNILLILYLRAVVYFDKLDLSSEELCEFIIKELNLPSSLIFKNEKISLTYRYSDNCFLNITDNILYRVLETYYNDVTRGLILGRIFISEIYLMCSNDAKKKIRTIKGNNRKSIYKYFMFDYINNLFNLNIENANRLEHLYYEPDHPLNTQPIDFIYKGIYDDYRSLNEKIVERDLENYIVKHNVLDIKIIHRQYKVNSGIVDLIGINKNNEYVMIELKVVKRPKDLIWQINSYKNDLLKIYPNIKTMVIAPGLDKSILNELPFDCEVVKFKKQKNNYKFEKIGGLIKNE